MKFITYTRGLSLGFTLQSSLEAPPECSTPASRQISLFGVPCDVWTFRDSRGRLTKIIVRLARHNQTPGWHDVI